MPALVTGTYSNASIFYSSYIDTYMERDVRRLSNDIDSLKFLRFLRSVAARTSQQVNYKGIADDARSTRPQPKTGFMFWRRWGSSFYWSPIPIMSSNAPYPHPSSTSDSGIVCYLTRWSSPETAMEGHERRTTGKLYRSGNHQDLSERRSGSHSCTITGIRMPEKST